MTAFFALFALMVVTHALCDYPLQGDFLARAKNRTAPIPGVPWWQALGAHAVIHGGAVWLVTGNAGCALGEVFAHWIIDDAKCRGWIGYNTDQALHLVCKAWWAALVVFIL